MKEEFPKLLATALVLSVILAVFAAFTESGAEAAAFSGMITETTDHGFSLYGENGYIHAVVTEHTLWDNDAELTAGDVVTVYSESPKNGSIVYADRISCHVLRGTVTEITESDESFFLIRSENSDGDIRVNLGDIPARQIAPGIPVEVWYNGMQTRSVPPQMTALYVRGRILRGTVTEILENGDISLKTEEGEAALLHLTEETVVLTEPEIGDSIQVSVYPQMLLSEPPQYEVQDMIPVNETKERKPICTV